MLLKLISIFYKNYSSKLAATFLSINPILLMAKYTALPNINHNWKCSQLVNRIKKKAKH